MRERETKATPIAAPLRRVSCSVRVRAWISHPLLRRPALTQHVSSQATRAARQKRAHTHTHAHARLSLLTGSVVRPRGATGPPPPPRAGSTARGPATARRARAPISEDAWRADMFVLQGRVIE